MKDLKVKHDYQQLLEKMRLEVNTTMPTQAEDISLKIKLFDRHHNPWNAQYFRIPSLLRTKRGTLLAFGDIRYQGPNDQSFIEIGYARSIDNGLSWDYGIAIQNNQVDPNRSRVMDTTAVVTDTNRILVLGGAWDTNAHNWTYSTQTPDPDWNPYLVMSDDDGITFSEKISLKNRVKNAPLNELGQPRYVSWLGGVGTGISMKHPSYRHRVIFPIQICLRVNEKNTYHAGCIYSDDNGLTWTMSQTFGEAFSSENMILELNDGSLIMNCRKDGSPNRACYISTDGGDHWNVYKPLENKFKHGLSYTSSCQGSWIKYLAKNGHEIGIVSFPKNTVNSFARNDITVYLYDLTTHQEAVELCIPYPKSGNPEGGGYSCLSYGMDEIHRECLNIMYEDDGSLILEDLSHLLPLIEKYSKLGHL